MQDEERRGVGGEVGVVSSSWNFLKKGVGGYLPSVCENFPIFFLPPSLPVCVGGTSIYRVTGCSAREVVLFSLFKIDPTDIG